MIDGISLIICCYNSSSRLPLTLMHIGQLEVPYGLQWEIIVVDNNSQDETSAVAEGVWISCGYPAPLKIIKEIEPGLTYARKRGVKEASFDLLLFCDDDNWLSKNYLSFCVEVMVHSNNIGILGGCSSGSFEIVKPVWFDRFANAYAVGEPHYESSVINARTFLAGAGMVIKKEILKQLESLSFQQLLSDRKGNQLSSGGDAEICLAALMLGYDLYYDKRLKFIHYMPASRLEWKYCVSMISEGQAIPQVYFDLYKACYRQMLCFQAADFEKAYREERIKLQRVFLRKLFPYGNRLAGLKRLVRSMPGSRQEIEVKAAFNKLRFLLRNKPQLREDFAKIELFIANIRRQQPLQDHVWLHY